jgi:hypothetical protein
VVHQLWGPSRHARRPLLLLLLLPRALLLKWVRYLAPHMLLLLLVRLKHMLLHLLHWCHF